MYYSIIIFMLAVLQPAALSAGNVDTWNLDLGNKPWDIIGSDLILLSSQHTEGQEYCKPSPLG